jgi:hypothetical protein
VKVAGQKAGEAHHTQEAAEAYAIELAQGMPSAEVMVQGRDGNFRLKSTHTGADPLPPRA